MGKRTIGASILAGLLAAGPAAAAGPTLAERLCESYGQVETVQCRVRKTSEADGHSMTLLSQVYYQRPDRMHVENTSPVRRRILADGTNFYYFVEGLARGYSCPLPRLEGEFRIMKQAVPGSAMEHLLRLKGLTETELPAEAEFPVRRGYAGDRVYAVLNCDAQGRLVRIDLFKAADRESKIAEIEYGDFHKVSDSCWLAGRQRGRAYFDGKTAVETRRFDSLIVNQPVAASLFDAGAFFRDVEFVDDFSRMGEASAAGKSGK